MVSSYSFTHLPIEHPPQFFDDIGGVRDVIQQKREITHYYQQYAWIQSDDSFLKMIGKIALACITLTVSLWVTILLDHWTKGQRNEAFQKRFQQLESEETEAKRNKFFNQTVNDFFRQGLKVDGKELYQHGWENLQKDRLASEDPQVQQKIEELRDIAEFAQIRALDSEDDEKLQQAKRIFYDAIESCVKTDLLPKLFERLKGKHGLMRALQIHDGFSQTLPNKMGDYLFHTFFKAIDGDFENFHYQCKWDDVEEISSGDMQINNNQTLFLHRNYRLCSTLDDDDEVTKARVELKLTINIETLIGHSEITFYSFDTVTKSEAIAMNRAWGSFGFNMPLPVLEE